MSTMEPELFVDALGFTALASAYIFIYSAYYFPSPAERPQPFQFTEQFRRYFLLFQVVCLLFPITWLLAAPLVGGVHTMWALRIAGPQLFLVVAQIVTERLTFGCGASLPVCILVAALYSARRMLSLYIWVVAGLQYMASASAEGHVTGRLQLTWLVLGQAIAVANFLLWGYNLFFFLMPVAIPKFLKTHYEVEAALSKKES